MDTQDYQHEYQFNYLIDAILDNDLETVVKCLKLGINPNKKFERYLYVMKNDRIINSGDTPLIIVSANNQVSILKCLLEYGTDVSIKDKYGRTALMTACNKSLECVRVLLSAGVDVNMQSSFGYTALMHALTKERNNDIIKELLKAGADAFIKNNEKLNSIDLCTGTSPKKLLNKAHISTLLGRNFLNTDLIRHTHKFL